MKALESENETSNVAKPVSIAICVITCFRPDGLRRLLAGLAAQKFTKNTYPKMQIVIVDNDAEGSARSICDEFTAKHNVKLQYDIEAQRGIPFARNHAVDMVKNNVDFIAIIDDDEVPAENWLDELLAAQQEFGADILTGPVIPHFMELTDPWLREFFGSGNLPNGHDLLHNYGYAYTSNLLGKAKLFQHIRFDDRFALIGAEDTHLFRQIFREGYKAVWADNARVTEWLPASRTNSKWLWKRAYSRGSRFALSELIQDRTLKTRIQRIAKGSFRFVQGLATAIVSVGRKPVFVRGVQTACLGMGMITGSFGIEYQEYKTIHRV